MVWGVSLLAVFVAGGAHGVQAGDVISPRWTGPRLGNLQCLVRNDTQRDLYVIPEWIECTNTGTVSTRGGKEMVPSENYDLVTTDRRACRCRATFDGQPGDVSIYLASGTDGGAPAIPGQAQCCRANARGCVWNSAVGCPKSP